MDMLDIQFNAATREYNAPLQVKANNGVLVIDDLGRQRFLPQRLFDRWIVPLEHHIDYLTSVRIAVQDTLQRHHRVLDQSRTRRAHGRRRAQETGLQDQARPAAGGSYMRVWIAVCDEMKVTFDKELLKLRAR